MKVTSKETCYFFTGLAIGAGAAVLLAPKPGVETVASLKHKAMEGIDSAKRQLDSAGSAVKDTVERGRQAWRQQTESLSAALQEGKRSYREAVNNPPPSLN